MDSGNALTRINCFMVLIVVTTASSIHVLDSTNLRSSVSDNPMSLVMFEAPWCPQCHEGRPVLEKTAEDRKDLFVASLDCETRETNALCNDEKVEAYPTVRLYRKGKEFVDFMDDITNEKLTKFINDPEGYPALMEEESKKSEKEKVPDRALELDALRVDLNQYQAFVTIGRNVFIMYYAQWCPRSNTLIDLVKKYEPEIKKMNLKLATCNCQIDSHQELCRKKMTHLPMVEVFVEGGLVTNSEKLFGDVIEWNDETFVKLLDGIKKTREERLQLLSSVNEDKEEEGQEDGSEQEDDGAEEESEEETDRANQVPKTSDENKNKKHVPKAPPQASPKKDEL